MNSNALEYEVQILGSYLTGGKIGAGINEAVFEKRAHKVIFPVIRELIANEIDPNILIVTKELEKRGLLDQAGGPDYIASLTNGYGDMNCEFYEKEVISAYRSRMMLHAVTLAKEALERGETPDKVIEGLTSNLKTKSVEKEKPHFEKINTRAVNPIRWLIKGLIESSSLALIFAEAGLGKSLLGICLSSCTATGTAFFGHVIKKPGAVLYIAAEGMGGLQRRFRAWEIVNNVSLKDAPIFRYCGAPNLLEKPGEIEAAIKSHIAKHGDPRLVVIDTWSRSLGADDSNTQEAAAGLANLDFIRSKFAETSFVIIHHSGHMEKGRARGWSGLFAAMDAVFMLEKSETQIVVKNTKSKETEPLSPLAFTIQKVKLDTVSEDGEDDYSAACIPCPYISPDKQPAGENQKAIFSAVREAGAILRDELYEKFAKQTGKRKTQFDQAINPMLDKGILKVSCGRVEIA
jgi:hypothetical protein